MALNRTAVLLISTLVMGHLSYHVLKPLFIPPSNNPTEPVPDKPVFWEPLATGQDTTEKAAD